MAFIKGLNDNQGMRVLTPMKSIDLFVRDSCADLKTNGVDIEIGGIDTEPVFVHLGYCRSPLQIFGDLGISLGQSDENYPNCASIHFHTSYPIANF